MVLSSLSVCWRCVRGYHLKNRVASSRRDQQSTRRHAAHCEPSRRTRTEDNLSAFSVSSTNRKRMNSSTRILEASTGMFRSASQDGQSYPLPGSSNTACAVAWVRIVMSTWNISTAYRDCSEHVCWRLCSTRVSRLSAFRGRSVLWWSRCHWRFGWPSGGRSGQHRWAYSMRTKGGVSHARYRCCLGVGWTVYTDGDIISDEARLTLWKNKRETLSMQRLHESSRA